MLCMPYLYICLYLEDSRFYAINFLVYHTFANVTLSLLLRYLGKRYFSSIVVKSLR